MITFTVSKRVVLQCGAVFEKNQTVQTERQSAIVNIKCEGHSVVGVAYIIEYVDAHMIPNLPPHQCDFQPVMRPRTERRQEHRSRPY